MGDIDSGQGSTAAGVEGVDSCPPGFMSTAAPGPSQAQSVQAVMDQLLRMEQILEERFARLKARWMLFW